MIPCVTLTLPENTAGPIFVNVEDPETVKEPVIVVAPWFVIFKNVTLPDFIVKALVPKLTDAETDPVAI